MLIFSKFYIRKIYSKDRWKNCIGSGGYCRRKLYLCDPSIFTSLPRFFRNFFIRLKSMKKYHYTATKFLLAGFLFWSCDKPHDQNRTDGYRGGDTYGNNRPVYNDQESLDRDLFVACGNGNLSQAIQALENGANINAQDSFEDTPLMKASYLRKKDIVEFLIKRGANINLKSRRDGKSALFIACEKQEWTIAEYLIKHGADVNVHDYDYGYTPLMEACKSGRLDIVTLLLQKGADTNLTNNRGETAFVKTLDLTHENKWEILHHLFLFSIFCHKGEKSLQFLTLKNFFCCWKRMVNYDAERCQFLNYAKTQYPPDTWEGFLRIIQPHF